MSLRPLEAPRLPPPPQIMRNRSDIFYYLVTRSRSLPLVQRRALNLPARELHVGFGSSGSFAFARYQQNGDAEYLPSTRVELVYSATEPNRWCVGVQYLIYFDRESLNKHRKLARLIFEKCMVLIGFLYTDPSIHILFKQHRCNQTFDSLGRYSEEMVRQFYV